MNGFQLIAVSGILGMLLVSGCVSVSETSNQGLREPEITLVGETQLTQSPGAPIENVDISVIEVSADKDTYHSSENMNLSMIIRTSADIDEVMVTAKGINGRMNLQKIMNLTAGDNGVSFSYTLPRCNVCGGISAGSYDLSCEVSYGNTTVKEKTSVEVLQ